MVETHIPALAEDQQRHIQSLLQYPASTPHLNAFGLVIRNSPAGSGRGVYASRPIAAETLIEISPVLLFPPAEYQRHGSKTQLDGYTFVWKRTSSGTAVMALALGLGSLFNHDRSPNVKWMLDRPSHSIRYVTVKEVQAGEELTISYGSGRMWWEPETEEQRLRDQDERRRGEDVVEEALQMGRIGLDDESEDEPVEAKQDAASAGNSVINGIELEPQAGPSRPNSNLPPIYRLTSALDPVSLPLTTRDAWIIDIPPQSASLAVKFLQKHAAILQNRDDGLHSTRHLRSFRTTSSKTQFLLCLRTALPDRARLVEWLDRQADGIFGSSPEPYVGQVPVIAAPTKARLAEWQAVWPCIVRTNPKELLPGNAGGPGSGPVLLVDRQKDKQMWEERARLRWALNRFKRVVALARYAMAQGGGRRSVASAVHVTHPFDAARRMVPEQGGMTWERREECDWSQLSGPEAPLVGRIQASATNVDEALVEEQHLDAQKSDLASSLAMTVDEWAAYNASARAVYTSRASLSTGTIEVDALDQRILRRNPLKHAVIEGVARVSVLRTLDRTSPSPSHPFNPATTPAEPPSSSSAAAAVGTSNGSDYLLTSLSLFTLYEPCVYCTMALVHSRVAEVYFLLPSPGRGACCGARLPEAARCDAAHDGGVYALQEQKGLNHSFAVWRWMHPRLALPTDDDDERADVEGITLDKLAKEFDIGLLDP